MTHHECESCGTLLYDEDDYEDDPEFVPDPNLPDPKLRVHYGAQWLDHHAWGWYNGDTAERIVGVKLEAGGERKFQLQHIGLDFFDLASGTQCVFGQMFSADAEGKQLDTYDTDPGWYNAGVMWMHQRPHNTEPMALLRYINSIPDGDVRLPCKLGFEATSDERGNIYELMGEQWVEEITLRRALAALAKAKRPLLRRIRAWFTQNPADAYKWSTP